MLLPTLINIAIVIVVIIAIFLVVFSLWPLVVRFGAKLGFWSERQIEEGNHNIEDERHHHNVEKATRDYKNERSKFQ